MRHKTAILAVVILAIVGGGAYWFLNDSAGRGEVMRLVGWLGGGSAKKPSGPAAAPPPVGVEVAKVRRAAARQTVQAVGNFRSFESVMIRPELASRITDFNFVEGQKVAKGQVLVRLDANLEEAMLAQAEAALVLSRANFERAQSLIARQAGTEKALDEARAALRRDEAVVQLTRTRIEKYALLAPFDGVVGLRRVSIGSYLGPGADIVNLEQIDPIKVDFRVPEVFLGAVSVGQTIEVTVDAFQGRAFEGKVYAIDPLVDEAGRAVVIRARIDNREEVLRPGVFARVTLTLALRENALWVPEHAVVPVGDRFQVYKVVENRSIPTFVKIGQRSGGDVEISEGVAADDTVIVAGHVKLPPRPAPVRIVSTTSPRQATMPPAPATPQSPAPAPPAANAPAPGTPASQRGG